MKAATLATLAPATMAAVLQGFNYGSVNSDNSPITLAQYTSMFSGAKNLAGASGFTAARLFTMIQGGNSNNAPTEAIEAAINTDTQLLLGLWASGGQTGITNEINALNAAVTTYGANFTNLIAGISVGSEDLYRDSVTGIQVNDGIGAGPDVLVNYIGQVRSAVSSLHITAPIGHVDTWTAWVNSSNSALFSSLDFVGVDAYPYFQTNDSNAVANEADLFFEAYNATVQAAGKVPVWITETGYPVSGPNSAAAVPSTANAQTYWKGVACRVLGNINTFWYTYYDGGSSPSFGVVGTQGSSTPLYDLSCPGKSSSSTSSSAAPSKTGTSGSSKVPAPVSGSKPAPAQASTVTSTAVVKTTICPTTTGAKTSGASGCPASLSGGNYQYPHLIVPVDSKQPNKAFGTQYNGTISSTESSLFNFDIPQSYSGKTCSLIFLLPQKSQLDTSSYTLSGTGGIDAKALSSPATKQTTYSNIPSVSKDLGGPSSVAAGNSYTIASFSCPAGKTVGYELSATGSMALEWFEDYNLPGLGLFITSC